MAGLFLLFQLILCLQLPQTHLKAQTVLSRMPDLFQFSQKYAQRGDVIIGAIATQFGCMFDKISFDGHPTTKLSNEIV